MAYTILDLKNDAIGIGHGLSLSKVDDPDTIATRAMNHLISEIDFFELVQEKQVANSIFDSIYDYPSPANLKMDKVIDIYPQVRREIWDETGRRYTEDFDRKKALVSGTFSVEYRNGIKVLRSNTKFDKPLLKPVSIGNFSSLTSNGTWVLGGDATNLSLDMVNYISGTASLRFDLSGAGTTWYVENDDITPIDLSQRIDGSFFDWVWMPDADEHTSIELRVGSSSSDYYTGTVTAQFFSAFVDGWNQMEYIIANMTAVGTPDLSAVSYVRIGGVYDGNAVIGMRVDSLVGILGSKYLIKYYNNSFIVDETTGAYKEKVTSDSDIIALESVSYNGYLFKFCEFMAQQVQNQGGSIDIEYFLGLYQNWKSNYTSSYKTQTKKPQARYTNLYRGRGYARTTNGRYAPN